MFTNYAYLIRMYKPDLALNNLQLLICHKTKPNATKRNETFLPCFDLQFRTTCIKG